MPLSQGIILQLFGQVSDNFGVANDGGFNWDDYECNDLEEFGVFMCDLHIFVCADVHACDSQYFDFIDQGGFYLEEDRADSGRKKTKIGARFLVHFWGEVQGWLRYIFRI